MKKTVCVLLCAALLLALSACRASGEKDNLETPPAAQTSAPTVPAGTTVPAETAAPVETTLPETPPETTQPPEPCAEHSWDNWAVTTAATCTQEGVQTRTCTVCGLDETQAIAMSDHSYGDWKVTAAAKCTTVGNRERTCSICKHVEKESIAATGHSYGDWKVTVAATCTAPGTREQVCKVCGSKASESIPAGHNWGSWTVTKQERYPNPGEQERTCSSCGTKETAVYKPTDAEKSAMALAVAKQIVAKVDQQLGTGAADLDRVGLAAAYVAGYSQSCVYSSEDKDYRTAYGVFCKGVYTCSGSTRAMGLVLECMGFQWSHANENQNTHQWCILTMDGQKGYADGQVGLVGYGDHPAAGW